ncbi:peptidylprolyl isomerase [Arsenicitalea aurantiaca]|nr:peptidylprolyl isomerase [Arsenicitalea aurantiaca]
MNSLTKPAHPALIARLAGALMLGVALIAAPAASVAQDAETTQAAPEASDAQAAPEAPNPDAVVATVGGETITEADLAFAAEDLAQELSNIPPAERRAFLLTVLIDMKVMANAARSEGLNDTETFQRRLAYLEERALRRAYFADRITPQVTPEALQAAYDALIGTIPAQEEIRARHILVETEEEANELKAQIDGGASFEELAVENSIDPGAANGGDLGFFRRGMMVAPFEQAAFALEDGQVSEPVQSQFGWHIIRLEERRDAQPPALEQVATQLQQQVLFEAFETEMEALKEGVEIVIEDPALAAAAAAAEGQAPEAGDADAQTAQ